MTGVTQGTELSSFSCSATAYRAWGPGVFGATVEGHNSEPQVMRWLSAVGAGDDRAECSDSYPHKVQEYE